MELTLSSNSLSAVIDCFKDEGPVRVHVTQGDLRAAKQDTIGFHVKPVPEGDEDIYVPGFFRFEIDRKQARYLRDFLTSFIEEK